MNAWIGNGKVDKPALPAGQREPCRLQVYSSEEVAENMVVSLAKMNIRGLVVHCSICKLIHVMEYRP